MVGLEADTRGWRDQRQSPGQARRGVLRRAGKGRWARGALRRRSIAYRCRSSPGRNRGSLDLGGNGAEGAPKRSLSRNAGEGGAHAEGVVGGGLFEWRPSPGLG